MERIRLHRDQIALVAAVVLPLTVAAVLVPFRSSLANTASALILVAVIVAVASLGNRFCGFVATVSATVWFDFFLTRPYEKLAITHRPDIETAVSLFVVGIIVTELAARNRHHHATAAEEADFVGRIYDVSELATSGASSQRSSSVCRTSSSPSCTFEPPVTRPARAIAPRCGSSMTDGLPRRQGVVCASHGAPRPGNRVDRAKPRPQMGRFVMTPTPGYEVSLERRVVAVAIADQVGHPLRPHLRLA